VKVCEWRQGAFTVWHFQQTLKNNPHVYADIIPPGSALNEKHIGFVARLNGFETHQEKTFSTFEEAKLWVETEVGKLFKTYK
jgi:hypothetical protein